MIPFVNLDDRVSRQIVDHETCHKYNEFRYTGIGDYAGYRLYRSVWEPVQGVFYPIEHETLMELKWGGKL